MRQPQLSNHLWQGIVSYCYDAAVNIRIERVKCVYNLRANLCGQ